jgi:hypothetical protein
LGFIFCPLFSHALPHNSFPASHAPNPTGPYTHRISKLYLLIGGITGIIGIDIRELVV